MANKKMVIGPGVFTPWKPRTDEQKEKASQTMKRIHAEKRCARAMAVMVECYPYLSKPIQRRIKALADSMMYDGWIHE